MFLGLCFHLHVNQMSVRGGFGQHMRTLIKDLPHVSSYLVKMSLDFSFFHQVLNLGNRLVLRNEAIKRLKRQSRAWLTSSSPKTRRWASVIAF